MSSSVLVDLLSKVSPSNGWSFGSISTSFQTSPRSLANVSRLSVCRRWVYPPFAQCKACDITKRSPHAHEIRRFFGSHSYRSAKPSLNSDLVRAKPYFCRGSAFNQLEAPFWRTASWHTTHPQLRLLPVFQFSWCLISVFWVRGGFSTVNFPQLGVPFRSDIHSERPIANSSRRCYCERECLDHRFLEGVRRANAAHLCGRSFQWEQVAAFPRSSILFFFVEMVLCRVSFGKETRVYSVYLVWRRGIRFEAIFGRG